MNSNQASASKNLITYLIIGLSLFSLHSHAKSQDSNHIPDARYQLTLNTHSQTLDVTLCVHKEIPLILTNYNIEQAKTISNIKQGDRKLIRTGNKIRMYPAGDKCLSYQVNLSKSGIPSPAKDSQDFTLVNTQSWFWFAPDFNLIAIQVADHKGSPIKAFFPFNTQSELFNISNSGLEWPSRTLFGAFTQQKLTLSKTSFDVALAGKSQARIHDWMQWLQTTAKAVESVYGQYPIDGAKILIIPIGKRSGPIPWGEVQRGGFPSIHFFIDETRSVEEFIQDWTGSHELSHLLLPKIHWRDRWLSEGIASYYQNVARARSGLLSHSEAWTKLKQGFARGRRDSHNRSLRNANKIMHIYWGGAAYFFLADLRLRDEGLSLDWVLQQFHQCCLPDADAWTAEELAARLDHISKTRIFTSLLTKEAKLREFPIQKQFESDANPVLKRHLQSILMGSNKSL